MLHLESLYKRNNSEQRLALLRWGRGKGHVPQYSGSIILGFCGCRLQQRYQVSQPIGCYEAVPVPLTVCREVLEGQGDVSLDAHWGSGVLQDLDHAGDDACLHTSIKLHAALDYAI